MPKIQNKKQKSQAGVNKLKEAYGKLIMKRSERAKIKKFRIGGKEIQGFHRGLNTPFLLDFVIRLSSKYLICK